MPGRFIPHTMYAMGPRVSDITALSLAILFAAHAILALAMKSSAGLATVHSVATIVVVLGVAMLSPRLYWIVCAGAYLVGSEVLWRMCGAAGPWELSKFGITAIFMIGLIRMRKYTLPAPAVIYFLLLVPGAIITILRVIHMPVLSRLSAHMSGPLALAACMCFLLNCRLSKEQIDRVLLAVAIPIFSICFVAAHGTFSRQINFGSQSVYAASGDFGPNQVAAVLGLGSLVLMLYLVRTPLGFWHKVLVGLVTVACLGQSALTLSRGGLYASVGAFFPAMFFLAGDGKSRKRMILTAATFAILGVAVIYPFVDEYTEGAVSRRFNERGMTGREALMNADIELWLENPLFGVGVGRSQLFHPTRGGIRIMTHNEFTRTLSEHGILGLAALIVLALTALNRMITAKTMEERALAASLITWSVLFLFVNGMRLAAPTFTFGLAMTAIRPSDNLARRV
jgi:O-Antigen ligase